MSLLDIRATLDRMQRDIEALKSAAEPAESGLYVRRRLLPVTANAFTAWAIGQGFRNVLPQEELHATVVYSRRTIPWQSLPSHVVVDEGTTFLLPWMRFVMALGDKGAVVLRFQSRALLARWQLAQTLGASWDHEGGYKPHITITYDGAGMDLDKVRPFADAIEFGPEVQGPINENWLDNLKRATTPP